MAAAEFGDFVGGVPVSRSNFAQVLARHAIEAVSGGTIIAGGGEQFVKRSPVVSPVEFETDALAELSLVNLTAKPLVQNVLVAGKNCFHSEHNRAVMAAQVAKQRGKIALGIGQRMVVADQNNSGPGNFAADIARRDHFLVAAVGLAKVAQILASGGRIDGADLTLDAGNSVKLSGAAPRS